MPLDLLAMLIVLTAKQKISGLRLGQHDPVGVRGDVHDAPGAVAAPPLAGLRVVEGELLPERGHQHPRARRRWSHLRLVDVPGERPGPGVQAPRGRVRVQANRSRGALRQSRRRSFGRYAVRLVSAGDLNRTRTAPGRASTYDWGLSGPTMVVARVSPLLRSQVSTRPAGV